MMELLAPAGSMETMKTAILYGADAVYMGGEMFGLRAKAKNFDKEQMKEAVEYAHARGVRVHVTVNIIAHNQHLTSLEEYLLFLQEIKVDALIMADAGMISIARKTVPNMEIHLSTQASATNYATFEFWHQQGVKRVVAAREISLEEMGEIRQHVSKDLVMEAFCHGAMCISISGRCLLSNYLAGRDSNLGACSHPCRWEYALMEKTRPGEYFPITEGEEGTYIFNSKDLCMIEYLPEMQAAGIGSIKIEGRMKSPLYVAMVTRAYRMALNDLEKDPKLYEKNKPEYIRMLSMVSHRSYTTGFYFGQPGPEDQIYASSEYVRDSDFIAVVTGGKDQDGFFTLEQRGKFSVGERVTAVPSTGSPIDFEVIQLFDGEGNEIQSAPHAQQVVKLAIPEGENGRIDEGCILIRQK